MTIPWGEIATFTTAGLSTAAAIGALLAANRSATTAEAVARIERERWHVELTPQFGFTLTETDRGQAVLNVHLKGPDALNHLDHVAIAVGDDDMTHELLHPEANLTQADYDNFVWGPFRFKPGVNGTDEHGRGPAPFALAVGSGQLMAMERTRPGHWMTGTIPALWQGRYIGKPIRLTLTCRQGDQEWVLAREIGNPGFNAEG